MQTGFYFSLNNITLVLITYFKVYNYLQRTPILNSAKLYIGDFWVFFRDTLNLSVYCCFIHENIPYLFQIKVPNNSKSQRGATRRCQSTKVWSTINGPHRNALLSIWFMEQQSNISTFQNRTSLRYQALRTAVSFSVPDSAKILSNTALT